MAERTSLPDSAFHVTGFSGRKFRIFMNNLMREVENPSYLEIGVFCGASLCPAICGNTMRGLGVDNWSWSGAEKAKFHAFYEQFSHPGAQIEIAQQDFRTVAYENHGPFNVLFYDGPHEEADQYDGVRLPMPAMAQESILIVDDWNWKQVRKGTLDALRDTGTVIDYSIELRTTFRNEHLPFHHGPISDWHNGALMAVISRPQA